MTYELLVKGSPAELVQALVMLNSLEPAVSPGRNTNLPIPKPDEVSSEKIEAEVKPLAPEKGLKKVSSSPAPKQEKKKTVEPEPEAEAEAEAEEDSDAKITLEQDQKHNEGEERLTLEDIRAVFNEKMKSDRAGLKEILTSYGVTGLTAFHEKHKDDTSIRREFMDKISAL